MRMKEKKNLSKTHMAKSKKIAMRTEWNLALFYSSLKDPQIDADRVKNAKYLVMVGVCTHLGCVPLKDKGEFNGWFCPCHGSHYDISGRVRKGPAPKNMEIPNYKFVDSNTIKIG